MNALMVFCAVMAFVYVPWDVLLKPAARDQEVWFGVMFTGWAAKVSGVLHWAVYAAGAYGFRKLRPWMWPWAALYAAQVAFGMFVWSVLHGPAGSWGWLLGAVAATPFALLARALWRARPVFDAPRPPLSERYGPWALVTGASAGIGREFARALAREGVSCVLSARRGERLRELAEELEKDWQVETRVAPANLAEPAEVEGLATAVSDLELGIVVNNAGFGYSGRFDAQETERLRDMVQVNCAAPVVLTSRLLPALRDRGRGALIFTGSVASRQPLPLHAVYAATKAFDLLLGEALAVELRESGVDVLVLEPGSTQTEFQGAAGEIPHPAEPAEQVVHAALDALGRQPSVVAGWFNWLRANLPSRLLPRSLVAHVAEGIMARYTPGSMR
jgi:short-subunit dehydrogenase